MARIRILVVDDSLTVRRHLCQAFGQDPELEVVGEAADGREAIELCQGLRPDIVTLDMMLPVMTGIAATEYIMAYCPTPILIVSASTNRGELHRTYDALAAGAVDVFDKPDGDTIDAQWARMLVERVKLVARVRVITHVRGRLRGTGSQAAGLGDVRTPASTRASLRADAPQRCVAIGVSTGGPAALVRILRAMPRRPQLPLVAVIHLDAPFAASFADWLDAQTTHAVGYARDGERVADSIGRLVLAPADRHLVIEGGSFRLTSDEPRHSCRPSVDVMFESVASEYGTGAMACLLTGMGRDGAQGLLAVRRAGGTTIAQDEATSVVYGMPREAVAIGAAERTMSLDAIAMMIAAATEVSPQGGAG